MKRRKAEIYIKGHPRYAKKKEIRFVINWMIQKLGMDGYTKPLRIEVTCTDNLKNRSGYTGFCIWEDSNYRPREFTIEVDAYRSRRSVLGAIIHEMVHVKQFASGKLQDFLRHYHIKKWGVERIDVSNIDYWDEPWEQEAYTYEARYWYEYSKFSKDNKKFAKRRQKKQRR